MICPDCGSDYPQEPHTPRCSLYIEISTLENEITLTIRAHAFVPLDARYRIARQLIADGWSKQ